MSQVAQPLSPLKQAMLALDKMQAKLERSEKMRTEPIAIVGIGCRFPGQASSPEAYWENLLGGVDAIREVPADRWNADDFFDPEPGPGKMYTRYGGFVDDVLRFDHRFFGISPREAAALDPQQRVLVEVVWEALEDAGILPGALHGSPTGMFLGICTADFANTYAVPDTVDSINLYTSLGTSFSAAPGRVSYTFGLQGPAMAVDTACSSSLVVLHLAIQALRARECDLALAGGVNLVLAPQGMIAFCQASMLAPDGRCKTFDSRADGFVRGDGCGVLVLKRASDVVAEDRVYAVVRGAAVNQDGRSAGLTAPNVRAQIDVLRRALTASRVDAAQVELVESHGTGTPLGDPIEAEALRTVYGGARPDGTRCAVGAVKSNIGHLEAAAGVAGVTKVALSLYHGRIPQNLHLRTLNPRIDLSGTPLYVPTQAAAWPRRDTPRRAAVSSFGFSGTNAHVLLEEAPRPADLPEAEAGPGLLLLSAKTAEALDRLTDRWVTHLRGRGAKGPLRDLTRTAALRRTAHEHRLAVTGDSHEAIAAALARAREGEELREVVRQGQTVVEAPRVAFVFAGVAPRKPGAHRELMAAFPTIRETLEEASRILADLGGFSLLDALDQPHEGRTLANEYIEQPSVIALQIALARQLMAWGITPEAVAGHSRGALAAAAAAGILPLEEALRIGILRGRTMGKAPPGGMSAVGLSWDEAEHWVRPYAGRLKAAVENGPGNTVISGRVDALDEIEAQLKAKGIYIARISSPYAPHGEDMVPVGAELEAATGRVDLRESTIRYYSPTRSALLEANALDARYWGDNVRNPVRMAQVARQMVEDGFTLFVDVSPHPALMGAISDMMRAAGRRGATVATLAKSGPSCELLLRSAGACWARGVPVDLPTVLAGSYRTVSLPTYPWGGDTFAFKPFSLEDDRRVGGLGRVAAFPLLGVGFVSATQPLATHWERALTPTDPVWLADHVIQGATLFPGAGYLELALEAASEAAGDRAAPVAIEQVVLSQVLPVHEDGVLVQVTEDPLAGITVHSRARNAEASSWTLHATARAVAPGAPAGVVDLDALRARCVEQVDLQAFYERLSGRGMVYGTTFRPLVGLWRGDGEGVAQIALHESIHGSASHHRVHPALLDGCLQAIGSAAIDTDSDTYLPVRVARVRLHRTVGAEVWCHVRLRELDEAKGVVHADVAVLDSDGHALLELEDFELERLGAGRRPATDDWGYMLRWEERALPPARDGASGNWIVLADSRAGARLAAQLRAGGARVVVASPGDGWSQDGDAVTLRPEQPEDFARLMQPFLGSGLKGIVDLWAADAAPPEGLGPDALRRAATVGPVSALHLVQAVAEANWRDAPRLWLVTAGAQPVGGDEPTRFTQSPLWGLGRTLRHEHPELRCTLVDLDPVHLDLEPLLAEIAADDDEDQLGFRGGARHVARLVPFVATEADAAEEPRQPAGDRSFRLEIAEPGILSNLTLRAFTDPPLGANEVRIAVRAASLNFIDVLKAMGIYPGQEQGAVLLGGDCAGVVEAVGSAVQDLAPGDRVAATAPAAMARRATTDRHYVTKLPDSVSFTQGGSIASAWVTAWFALVELGRVRRGQVVLVHSGTGGTGLAAIAIARSRGARVFATAGTEERRQFLRDLGVDLVMDSRSTAFAEQVRAATEGRGVDFVLNSLSDDGWLASLECLARFGHFLDISKKDIYGDRKLGMFPFHRSLSYTAIDLGQVITEQPERFAAMFADVVAALADGSLAALPVTSFPIADAAAAFHHMAQGNRHIGKVSLSVDDAALTAIVPSKGAPIRPDGTYLVTGGLGGLGLELARWLVDSGAGAVALMGRSAPGPAAAAAIDALRARGGRVEVVRGDVTQLDVLRDAIDTIHRTLPPLRGVIHGAAVLEDATALKTRAEQVHRVMQPKVLGTWNLHLATADRPLDAFVLFSSAAALLGSPGQSNYAAANAFLQGFATWRRSLGMPALTIDWGTWADVGLAAADASRGERLAMQGMVPIAPELGTSALGTLMARRPAHVAMMPIDLRQWRQYYPRAKVPAFEHLLAALESGPKAARSAIREALESAEVSERRPLLEAFLRDELTTVLRLGADEIDARTPLSSLGIDSLMSLEIRNRLEARLALSLPSTLLWSHPDVASLTAHLARELGMELDDAAAARSQAAEAQLKDEDAILEELGALSDDDLAALFGED